MLCAKRFKPLSWAHDTIFWNFKNLVFEMLVRSSLAFVISESCFTLLH